MFELPLYPLNGEYGRIQRRIAQSHNVVLIPRHVLTQIIITPGNTIEDGLHLSVAGQRFMATRIWELIGPALPR
jgi:lysophospholipase L1-like esterase